MVLDAGSTGTRVHVFQYAADTSSSYATLNLPEPKLKVQPGLSAYANDALGAAASLQPLLQFAAQHIPASQIPRTPVYLMATAGLRLLPTAAADGILMECRSALQASDFMFQPDWAQIISGTYEGLYAWVAANYAAGHLQVREAIMAQNELWSALYCLCGCSRVCTAPSSCCSCSTGRTSAARCAVLTASCCMHRQPSEELHVLLPLLLLQSAAEDAAHSRKDLHSGHMGFKALLEMGGASAQVTFMPDPQWHKHSTGSSKQRVRLRLPGRLLWLLVMLSQAAVGVAKDGGAHSRQAPQCCMPHALSGDGC